MAFAWTTANDAAFFDVDLFMLYNTQLDVFYVHVTPDPILVLCSNGTRRFLRYPTFFRTVVRLGVQKYMDSSSPLHRNRAQLDPKEKPPTELHLPRFGSSR
jgi:hypothetical protein